jgi:predicted RND superfamily exporter protein
MKRVGFIAAQDAQRQVPAGWRQRRRGRDQRAVEHAEVQMLGSIFGAITLLCWLTFRSWRAVLCIVVPLAIVSILCNALMAMLGVGLKVPTLPVVALGVGVGVDYGIYLFESMQHELRERDITLREAFYEAMRQRATPPSSQR